jgi:hypothetical protein
MVNLLNHYRFNGLDPGTSELPDFLPLFLEFLSTQPGAMRWPCSAKPSRSWRCCEPGWSDVARPTPSC